MYEILVVEDESDISKILAFNLESAGYSVTCASSAEEGLEKLHQGTSLAILDVMLPGMSGFQMAAEIRRGPYASLPVIFLTARTCESDVLTGFSAGGDDYLGKPFSTSELLARVKAVIKRSGAARSEGDVLTLGPLSIDRKAVSVTLDGKPISLSHKEYKILELLVSKQGTYIPRSEIIARLWQDAPYVIDRTIDVHVARIRVKLGAYRDIIRSKTGFGYCANPEFRLK
ncbi:MAG: response regulator transcription factor [Bacteroidales bacterium]|mgnify:FL=1|nr:response regulator transcription factor [Bacteroidales bacterium]